MLSKLSKISNWAGKHKLVAVVSIGVIVIGGYFGYQRFAKDENATRYVTAAVERGELVISMSGSGQVSASDQIDIKPKVSGDIDYIGVKNGQEVKTGALLARIDIKDVEKTVRDAKIALETAELELEDLLSPVDELALLQASNALSQAKESKETAEDNIENAYEDAFNTVASVFLDLPTIITGLSDILHSNDIAESENTISNYSSNVSVLENSVDYEDRYGLEQFTNSAEDDYEIARKKYDGNFENYKNTSRYSAETIIEDLLDETIETTKAMAEAIKGEANMFDYWVDYRSEKDLRIFSRVSAYQSDLNTYTGETNSHLSSLLSIQRSLQDSREAIINAKRLIGEKELYLADLKASPDDLDIRAKEILVQQAEDALLDAQENLADHYIYALFGGVIANIDIKRGEAISASTVLATLVTKQKIAEIILNEIDIAKIENGQKVSISFDAVEGLSITGEVVEIDTLGVVTQGVVTYGVKIALETQDQRVKPGMSISASVITDIRENILLVPNSALKQEGSILYVEVASDITGESHNITTNASDRMPTLTPNIEIRSVETGLSNDIVTEIIGGLEEGEFVVTRTINSSVPVSEFQQKMEEDRNEMRGMMRVMH